MLYFDTLPKVITLDPSNNSVLATNILARASILQNLLVNPVLFYSYDIQDGDTPEIVAAKYYGDSYRYWLVLFANQILDPQWQWPLSSQQFQAYMNDKYGSAAANNNQTVVAYTQSITKEYRKIYTSYDSSTANTTTINYTIDSNTYNNLITSTQTVQFPSGDSCTITIDKAKIDLYTYEVEQNDAKRTINLINVIYAGQFEQELDTLMNS
jgi:hypothetical protein